MQTAQQFVWRGGAKDQDTRLKEIEEREGSCNDHCCAVQRYEDRKNGNDLKPVRTKKRMPDEMYGSDSDADESETEVACVHGVQFEAKRLLGILWPVDFYCDHEKIDKSKIRKNDVESFSIGGTIHRGILRDPKFGEPLRAERIYANSFAMAWLESSKSLEIL